MTFFSFLIRRIFYAVLTIWGVISLTFVILHTAPGDPTSIYIRPDIAPEIVESIRHQLGLGKPVYLQYLDWLKQWTSGNLGISFAHNRPVANVLAETIPNTLQLTVVVFIVQGIAGVLLGLFMAIKHHTFWDTFLDKILLFFYSLPGFWLALIAILIFSLKLGWFPSSHISSIYLPQNDTWHILLDRLKHLFLPALILSIPFIAFTARYVRGNLIEVLQQDYVRTAIAYGLPRKQIFFKYALRNALLPLATLTGLYLPFLLGGAVVTEYIFSWNGMGRLTINAILSHDYPVILATFLISAISVVIGNLLSDILYALIDPRVSLN